MLPRDKSLFDKMLLGFSVGPVLAAAKVLLSPGFENLILLRVGGLLWVLGMAALALRAAYTGFRVLWAGDEDWRIQARYQAITALVYAVAFVLCYRLLQHIDGP